MDNIDHIRERFITPQSEAEALDPDAHLIMGEVFDKFVRELMAQGWNEGSVSRQDDNPYEEK